MISPGEICDWYSLAWADQFLPSKGGIWPYLSWIGEILRSQGRGWENWIPCFPCKLYGGVEPTSLSVVVIMESWSMLSRAPAPLWRQLQGQLYPSKSCCYGIFLL